MKLRSYRDEDFEAALCVINSRGRELYGTDGFGIGEFREWLTSPRLDIPNDIRIAEDDGRVVGYADVDVQPGEPRRVWSEVSARADVDVEAVFDQLLDWVEARAGSGTLRVWTAARAARERAVYQARGFAAARHSYRMEGELTGELPPPAWPEGLEVRTLVEGGERQVYDAHMEAFADTWEPWEQDFEEWSHYLLDSSSFDPGLWFLAWDGDELAGYAISHVSETAPEAGYVALLGVRRRWRRRGLGEALLRHALLELRAQGLGRVYLGVDAENPTGATRLYERVGMTVARETVIYEKHL